jgi:methyl-accepting chemotaxis protein
MMRLGRLSIRSEILLISVIPTMMVIASFLYFWSRSWYTHLEMKEVTLLTRMVPYATEMIHELQKERGYSSGFLSSEGDNFNQELRQQHLRTNEKVARFLEELAALDKIGLKGRFSQFELAREKCLKIAVARDRVLSGEALYGVTLNFYTEIIEHCISEIERLSFKIKDPRLVQSLQALTNFSNAKERSGLIRARLSKAFVLNTFSDSADYALFIRLVSLQDEYMRNFEAMARPEHVNFFKQIIQTSAYIDSERMKQKAFNKGLQGGFDFSPELWFDLQTQKMDAFQTVENNLIQDISTYSAKRSEQAQQMLFVFTLVSLFGVLMGIRSLVFSRAVVSSIQQSLNFVQKVTGGNLTQDIKVEQHNEQGHLMNGLNQMVANLRNRIEEVNHNGEQTKQAIRIMNRCTESTLEQCETLCERVVTSKDITAKIMDQDETVEPVGFGRLRQRAQDLEQHLESMIKHTQCLSDQGTQSLIANGKLSNLVQKTLEAVQELNPILGELPGNSQKRATLRQEITKEIQHARESLSHLADLSKQVVVKHHKIQELQQSINLHASTPEAEQKNLIRLQMKAVAPKVLPEVTIEQEFDQISEAIGENKAALKRMENALINLNQFEEDTDLTLAKQIASMERVETKFPNIRRQMEGLEETTMSLADQAKDISGELFEAVNKMRLVAQSALELNREVRAVDHNLGETYNAMMETHDRMIEMQSAAKTSEAEIKKLNQQVGYFKT